MSKPRILIIDDEPRDFQAFRQQYAETFEVVMVGTPALGFSQVKTQAWDAVLVDLDFDNKGYENGLNNVLPNVSEAINKSCPVLVVTSDNRKNTAVIALQKGANDFIRKDETTADSLAAAIQKQIREFKDAPAKEQGEHAIIGHAPAMLALKARWDKFIDYPEATVLLLGESGTGKELAARYIHAAKKRPDHPFVAVNLRELNPNLLESELFGHVKGAYTGAEKDKTGYLEEAANGTLFLDEIGEVDEAIQIKLLRVLENRTFSKVGDTNPISLRAQLLFATNKSLEEALADGSLRRDFFERISALSFTLPPLRERTEDIEALANHFLRQYCASPRHPLYGKTAQAAFALDAWQAMLGFAWPGNIRELSNELRRLAFEADFQAAGTISKEMLSPRFFQSVAAKSALIRGTPAHQAISVVAPSADNWPLDKLATYEELKRIEEALNKEAGRKLEAAQRLGLKNDQTLRYRIHSRYERFPELFADFAVIRKVYKL